MKKNSIQYIYALCGGSAFETLCTLQSVYSYMFSSSVCVYFFIHSLVNKWWAIIF